MITKQCNLFIDYSRS